MPHVKVNSSDKDRALRLMEFVKKEFSDFSVDSRFVFAIEMIRLLGPELAELKRKAAEGKKE